VPPNSIDHIKLDQALVKAIHWHHFRSVIYRNFVPLYQSKARAYRVSLTLDGHQKSKLLFFVAFCWKYFNKGEGHQHRSTFEAKRNLDNSNPFEEESNKHQDIDKKMPPKKQDQLSKMVPT
jgi:hypothetical protein